MYIRKTSDLLLCSEAGEKGVDIRGYLYKDGKLSKEIPITNQDKYIKEPNGFYQDGEFYVVFTRSTADICDTEMMSSTDICTMHFKEYEDLKLIICLWMKKRLLQDKKAHYR